MSSVTKERKKIRIIRYLNGVFPEYQPEIGKIYDADWFPDSYGVKMATIQIKDKIIIVYLDEFEFIECSKCGWYENCMSVCFNEKSEFNAEIVKPNFYCDCFEKEWRE